MAMINAQMQTGASARITRPLRVLLAGAALVSTLLLPRMANGDEYVVTVRRSASNPACNVRYELEDLGRRGMQIDPEDRRRIFNAVCDAEDRKKRSTGRDAESGRTSRGRDRQVCPIHPNDYARLNTPRDPAEAAMIVFSATAAAQCGDRGILVPDKRRQTWQ